MKNSNKNENKRNFAKLPEWQRLIVLRGAFSKRMCKFINRKVI